MKTIDVNKKMLLKEKKTITNTLLSKAIYDFFLAIVIITVSTATVFC